MKTSKRKFEGVFVLDHRDSPGLTPEQVQGHGPVVGKGQLLETPTSTCVHCQRIVILNPLRTRPRHYCQKCDDFQCDLCANLPCLPFLKLVEQIQNAAAAGHPICLPERFQL